MYRQMKFVATKDLGYNKDQTLVIQTRAGWMDKQANKMVERFKTRAQGESGIISVAGTGSSFAQGAGRLMFNIKEEEKAAYVFAVDPGLHSHTRHPSGAGKKFRCENIFGFVCSDRKRGLGTRHEVD